MSGGINGLQGWKWCGGSGDKDDDDDDDDNDPIIITIFDWKPFSHGNFVSFILNDHIYTVIL